MSPHPLSGFSEEDKKNMYRGTGAIMWLGNAKFKQKGEQAEPDGVDGRAEIAETIFLSVLYHILLSGCVLSVLYCFVLYFLPHRFLVFRFIWQRWEKQPICWVWMQIIWWKL